MATHSGKVTIDICGNWDYGRSLALDNSGNVFVAGYAYTGSNNDFAVIKLDPSGELATDFGGDGTGKITIDISGSSDYGQSLALDYTGNLFVAGYANTGSDYDFAVIKLDPSGELATDFGVNGKVTIDICNSSYSYPGDRGYSLALDNSGNVFVAGYAYTGSSTDFAVIKLDSSGVLATDFGSGTGKTTIDFGGTWDYGYSLALDNSGNVFVAGNKSTDFAVIKLDSSGVLATDFGSGTGKTIIDICGNNDKGYSLALDDDGNVFVAGYAYTDSNNDFAVIKLDPSGELATDFGGDGKVTIDICGSSDYGQSLALDDDGNVFVAGYAYTGSNYDFAVIKLDPSGELATEFDGDGKVTIDFGGNDDYGYSLALDDDGNVFVAGSAYTDIAVIKLTPTGELATDFGELIPPPPPPPPPPPNPCPCPKINKASKQNTSTVIRQFSRAQVNSMRLRSGRRFR